MEQSAVELEGEVQKLAAENAALRERIKALASDPDALAAEARSFGLAGNGEIIYTFVPEAAHD